MSHLPERKEKICLNCKSVIYGRFCHICGQENVEPKESFWHLITHFVYDVTHFDGKFFSTLKYLLLRPGYLSKEYLRGRRTAYLNPIRMYVFTSAIFFLIFFTFIKPEPETAGISVNGKSLEAIDKMDSASFATFTSNINKEDGKPAVPMTREEFKRYMDTVQQSKGIHFTPGKYTSKREYDSLLLTGKKKHNWLERQLVYRNIELNEKYHNNSKSMLAALFETFLHSLPQILFISLPLLALILQLLYVRRPQFYYVNHIIFGVHFYIFLFIDMLLIFLSSRLYKFTSFSLFRIVDWFLVIFLFIYEYKALRNFYQQSRGKTIVKFLLLNFVFAILLSFLFLLFLLVSLFKI